MWQQVRETEKFWFLVPEIDQNLIPQPCSCAWKQHVIIIEQCGSGLFHHTEHYLARVHHVETSVLESETSYYILHVFTHFKDKISLYSTSHR